MGKFVEVGTGIGRGESSFAAAREAAAEALRQVGDFKPSLTLVFASGSFDPDEVARGVAAITGDCPMIGTSTAGEIRGELTDGGVVVTILASPYLSAEVGVGEGVGQDWLGAVRSALPEGLPAVYFRDAPKLGRPSYFSHPLSGLSPLFVLLFSPGLTIEQPSLSHEIHTFLKKRTLGRVPIVGGSSSTPDLSLGNFQIANGRAYRDAVVLATVETELLFGVGVAHGFRPTRSRAVVTRAEGHVVYELDDRPAAEVCAELMGTDPAELAERPIWFLRKPFGSPGPYGQHNLLVAERLLNGGAIQFGPVMEGIEAVTLMEVDRERPATPAQEAVAKAIEIGYVNDTAAVLLFSCYLRCSLDEDAPQAEEEGIRSVSETAPTTGFLTFGEYGLTEEGLPIYCNQSVVALVLGDELELAAVATRQRVNALREVETQLQKRSRELTAIRRANEIVLDRHNWRSNLKSFERILCELTGAHTVHFDINVTQQPLPDGEETEARDTSLLLPLVSLGQLFGTVEIRGDEPLKSREVASSICQLVARGMHSVFLERTVEEQAREIEAVQTMAREVLTASDYRASLLNISSQVGKHLGASGLSLWIGGEQAALVCVNDTMQSVNGTGHRLARQAVASGEIEREEGAEADYIAAPLLVKDRVNGALVLRFAKADPRLALKVGFLGYLSMPLAVMVEIYTRHRESNVAREIHHRVKNNLQVIASLLNLQLTRVADPAAREPLENSISRIMSIAVVHEALCEKHPGEVDALGLIRSIADLVVQSSGAPGQKLSLSVEGASTLTLSSQQASNLAVLANELLGNALKHGLRGRARGGISVRLEEDAGLVVLSVRDDGGGLPPGFDLGRCQGLGLQLITALVQNELLGRFSIENRETGVEARVEFPEDSVKAARGDW